MNVMTMLDHTIMARLLRTVTDGAIMRESRGKQVQRMSHLYAITSVIKWPSKERKMEKRRHSVTAVLCLWDT